MKRSVIRTKPPRNLKRRKRTGPVHNRCSAHPASKLSDTERRRIISIYDRGHVSQNELAYKFGITQSAISHIVRVQRKWLEA